MTDWIWTGVCLALKPSLPLHVRPQVQIRTRNVEKGSKFTNLIILLLKSVNVQNLGQNKPDTDRCVHPLPSNCASYPKHHFTSCHLSPATTCHVYCVPSRNSQNLFPSCLPDWLTPHNSDLQTFNFLSQLPIFFLTEGSEECIWTYLIFPVLEVFMSKTLAQPLVTCCLLKRISA